MIDTAEKDEDKACHRAEAREDVALASPLATLAPHEVFSNEYISELVALKLEPGDIVND